MLPSTQSSLTLDLALESLEVSLVTLDQEFFTLSLAPDFVSDLLGFLACGQLSDTVALPISAVLLRSCDWTYQG